MATLRAAPWGPTDEANEQLWRYCARAVSDRDASTAVARLRFAADALELVRQHPDVAPELGGYVAATLGGDRTTIALATMTLHAVFDAMTRTKLWRRA